MTTSQTKAKIHVFVFLLKNLYKYLISLSVIILQFVYSNIFPDSGDF